MIPPGPIRPVHHTVRLVICYRNFSAHRGISHIGLGVSAMQNARALRALGYIVEIWPLADGAELADKLAHDRITAELAHHVPISHVVIHAPWVLAALLAGLAYRYNDIEFCVVCHSNLGFLQVDPGAIALMRAYSALEQAAPNFHIGANGDRLQAWWTATYGTRMLLLPNMYPFDSIRQRPQWRGGTLRIGCFGAMRPQKNVLTAAGAALEVGVRLRVTDLEFWTSGGRVEAGGGSIVLAIQQMYLGMPRARWVARNWQSWTDFLVSLGSMDLLLQPSYTESFNMVTADGIARAIPSVIGEAIDWAPRNWIAACDSAADIANKAIALLHDPGAMQEGMAALTAHNQAALREWESFLAVRP